MSLINGQRLSQRCGDSPLVRRGRHAKTRSIAVAVTRFHLSGWPFAGEDACYPPRDTAVQVGDKSARI